jgi:rod shape determining protein RodA
MWLLIKIGLGLVRPLLIMQQPDLGTSLVIMSIMLGMIFISGVSWKILPPIVSGGIVVAQRSYTCPWKPEILENT